MKNLKIFTNVIEDEAVSQINRLCEMTEFKDCKIRIMPDVHAGKGCVIGFTGCLGEYVIPNIVGVDIGCGVLTVPLGKCDIDYREFDKVVRDVMPAGRNVFHERQEHFEELQNLTCYRNLRDSKKLERAIGTLGGGNHFVEIDVDNDNNKYLLIHTGSRHLGLEVANYHQNIAIDLSNGKDELFKQKENIIKTYKEQGRKDEIQKALKELDKNFKETNTDIPKDLAYLFGKYKDDYLHDVYICQQFAALNRFTIAKNILETYFKDCKVRLSYGGSFKLVLKGKYNTKSQWFDTIHNYVDLDDINNPIIRKGAVAAYEGQMLVIPINMRDGALICKGKGNEDWNYSAPHGAGRLLSRTQAEQTLELSEYAKQMEGIYSTCINESTLDESPMAYKSIESIIDNIGDTVEIVNRIRPVYNFKAGKEER